MLNLLIPDQTFESKETKEYRAWLNKQYELNDIKIYEFINGNYTCPHCFKNNTDTKHDVYIIKNSRENKKTFQIQKSDWTFKFW